MKQRFEFKSRSFSVSTPGIALDRSIRDAHPGSSWNDARRLVASGKVAINLVVARDPQTLVPSGSTISIDMNTRSATAARKAVTLVHADSQLVVVDKPPGLSTVPFDATETDTLLSRVQNELKRIGCGTHPPAIFTVHRIDKETSGLLVFARTQSALRHLKHQFRVHSVTRSYLAIAHGAVHDMRIESRLVPNRGDGLRGSTRNPTLGQRAVTHVEAQEGLNGATLVRCRLETGRTHQIRIHLSEAGHPLVGERVYSRDYDATLLPAPRLMLHAETLGFLHPSRKENATFRSRLPCDMQGVLDTLRTR